MTGHDSAAEEQRLAAALAAFDADAWDQLFRREYRRIYSYAYVRVGNVSDADDIAASVFVEAVRGISRFVFRGLPITSWLLGIAHHETADLLTRRARHASVSLDEAGGELWRDHGTSAELRELLEVIATLRPDYRDVLLLRFVQDLSVRDTAAILARREGAVRLLQFRALQALRRAWKRSDESAAIDRRSNDDPSVQRSNP